MKFQVQRGGNVRDARKIFSPDISVFPIRETQLKKTNAIAHMLAHPVSHFNWNSFENDEYSAYFN